MDILIAEDDRVSALMLQRSLEKLGYSVTVARDGCEAWRLVNEGPVSLMISDWMMPEVDGLELIRRIRQRADSLYTYVILLTARDGRDDRIEGLQAGADDFLCKPLDAGELMARLNVARRILAMQDELRAHAAQLAELHAALERQNALLAQRAATDGLTGLANRRQFDESLAAAVSFASRHAQPLSVVIADVDRFKEYNDEFGHQAGDNALRAVADTLRTSARTHDIVARYGGEEFALILPSTSASASLCACERFRSAIAGHPWPMRPITISLGAATVMEPSGSPAEIVRQADRALYASKAAGRNCVTHFEQFFERPVAVEEGSGSSVGDLSMTDG